MISRSFFFLYFPSFLILLPYPPCPQKKQLLSPLSLKCHFLTYTSHKRNNHSLHTLSFLLSLSLSHSFYLCLLSISNLYLCCYFNIKLIQTRTHPAISSQPHPKNSNLVPKLKFLILENPHCSVYCTNRIEQGNKRSTKLKERNHYKERKS